MSWNVSFLKSKTDEVHDWRILWENSLGELTLSERPVDSIIGAIF